MAYNLIKRLKESNQKYAERVAETLLPENEVVPHDILPLVKQLDLSLADLKDFSQIGKFKNLEYLELAGAEIVDLRPLKTLTKLKFLNITRTVVQELEGVEPLVRLEELWMRDTPIVDLTPLANLRSLKIIAAEGASISDWSAVAHVETVHGRPKEN